MRLAKRTNNRLVFNIKCLFREITPNVLFRSRLNSKLAELEDTLSHDLRQRLDFYCKLNGQHALATDVPLVRDVPRDSSTYYCDFTHSTRHFNPNLQLQVLFGDIMGLDYIPAGPTILKSRPVAGDNESCVLFKLNKVRHNFRMRDQRSFGDKQDNVVWRGVGNTTQRRDVAAKLYGHHLFDIGLTSSDEAGELKQRIPIVEQLGSKFIVSMQGVDLATNLHWAMSSNSVCVMPRPKNEGWSMESQLVPGEHYIYVKDDFSDLEAQFEYYLSRPAECEEISRNAQKFISQFYNKRNEDALQLMVLYRYFQRTGQME